MIQTHSLQNNQTHIWLKYYMMNEMIFSPHRRICHSAELALQRREQFLVCLSAHSLNWQSFVWEMNNSYKQMIKDTHTWRHSKDNTMLCTNMS